MQEEYHTDQDTADKLNIIGMEKVASHAEKLIRELAKEDPESFQFRQMNRRPNPVIEPGTPTLGLLPDYLFRGSGLRIDEVTQGDKADQAGLQPGDIIKSMNGMSISNIFDYMNALESISENESVELEYMRNEQLTTVIIPF
jgi:S1-C subfamily serine protease